MAVVRIVIPGVPVAKGRPRFTTRGGFARAYTPGKTRDYEAALANAGRDAMAGAEPLQGPLSVIMHVRLPIPASWSKARHASAVQGGTRPTSKPDADNYLKCVDALNGIVWNDDGQIVDARVIKYYADEPCVTVEVEAV